MTKSLLTVDQYNPYQSKLRLRSGFFSSIIRSSLFTYTTDANGRAISKITEDGTDSIGVSLQSGVFNYTNKYYYKYVKISGKFTSLIKTSIIYMSQAVMESYPYPEQFPTWGLTYVNGNVVTMARKIQNGNARDYANVISGVFSSTIKQSINSYVLYGTIYVRDISCDGDNILITQRVTLPTYGPISLGYVMSGVLTSIIKTSYQFINNDFYGISWDGDLELTITSTVTYYPPGGYNNIKLYTLRGQFTSVITSSYTYIWGVATSIPSLENNTLSERLNAFDFIFDKKSLVLKSHLFV